MLRSISFALVALFSITFVATHSAQAQQQQNGGIVAVLDLSKVFEEHAGHRDRMKQLEAAAEKMKTSFQSETEKLQQDAQAAAKQFQGDALNSQEIELRKKEVELQTRARQAQNELLKQEAAAYYETYNEVMSHVTRVAKHYNVSVVLRWDSTPIDPANPSTVIRGVQRTVVYTTADLTPAVLMSLEESKQRVAQNPTNQK